MDTATLLKLINVFRFIEWIKVIAITGGPCGGKSTFLKMAIKLLQGHGFRVIVIPEVARELIASGIAPWDPSWIKTTDFQKHVLFNILEKEASFFRSLADMNLAGQKVVFLCDRGIPDGAAYCGEEEFDTLLASLGTTRADVTDRYDGVIHLVTTADGKPEFYKTDEERHETPEQAVEIDHKTRYAWHGHTHFQLVDNSSDSFGEKINLALLALQRLIPMPETQEIERKFKVTNFTLDMIPAGTKSFEIRQTYLNRPDKTDVECRVREKITDGVSTYTYTEKVSTKIEGVRGEHEENISEMKFKELVQTYGAWTTIEKTRYKIPYGSLVLELDVYEGGLASLVVCECEFKSTDEMNGFVPPSNLGRWEDVTPNKAYSNASLAKHGLPAAA